MAQFCSRIVSRRFFHGISLKFIMNLSSELVKDDSGTSVQPVFKKAVAVANIEIA